MAAEVVKARAANQPPALWFLGQCRPMGGIYFLGSAWGTHDFRYYL